MKKCKLNYRFHNPNTEATTIDYILRVFIEANTGKVESAIRAAAEELPDGDKETLCCEGHSA